MIYCANPDCFRAAIKQEVVGEVGMTADPGWFVQYSVALCDRHNVDGLPPHNYISTTAVLIRR